MLEIQQNHDLSCKTHYTETPPVHHPLHDSKIGYYNSHSAHPVYVCRYVHKVLTKSTLGVSVLLSYCFIFFNHLTIQNIHNTITSSTVTIRINCMRHLFICSLIIKKSTDFGHYLIIVSTYKVNGAT